MVGAPCTGPNLALSSHDLPCLLNGVVYSSPPPIWSTSTCAQVRSYPKSLLQGASPALHVRRSELKTESFFMKCTTAPSRYHRKLQSIVVEHSAPCAPAHKYLMQTARRGCAPAGDGASVTRGIPPQMTTPSSIRIPQSLLVWPLWLSESNASGLRPRTADVASLLPFRPASLAVARAGSSSRVHAHH